MSGKRSASWNHFVEAEKEKAKCKLCRVIISIKHGNVCNMSRHLKAKHPELFGGVLPAKVKADRKKSVRRYISVTGDIGYGSTSFKRSPSWNHFIKLDGPRTKCKYCFGVLSIKRGNICNMRRHLLLRHPEVLEEEAVRSPTPKSPEQTPTSTEDTHIQIQIHKEEPPEESILPEPEEVVMAAQPVAEAMPKITPPPIPTEIFLPAPLTPSRYGQINQQLLRMIIKESHPLDIVDQVEFKKFVNLLHPKYMIPSPKTLAATHIPKLYESIKGEIRAKVGKASAVCVSTHMWTLRNEQRFLSVTAHFIAEDVSLTAVFIECTEVPQTHTADEVCHELERIFNDWDIANKIVAVVTDNTEIIASAVLKGKWCHLPCMTYTLDGVVRDALQEIGEVRNKCKGIVEFFQRNSHHSAALASFQKQMNIEPVELEQDVITRWNTTYDMLKGFLSTKAALESSLAQLGADNSLSPTDWLIIERSCEILKAFEEVNTEMSGEKDVTLSKEFILISGLKLMLHEFNVKQVPEEVIAFTARLLEGLNAHFEYLESNQLVLESALLDPRFKDHAFPSENVFNDAYQLLSATASEAKVPVQVPENPAPTTSTSSVWHYFEKRVRTSTAMLNSIDGALMELDRYIQETHAPRDSNPFTWWSDRRVYYPRLYEIMRSRLCIVPSLPLERVGTKTEMLLCDRQEKISSLKMSQIVFLKFNLK